MKAKVTFNDDAEPVSFRVFEGNGCGHSATFTMDGETAVVTSVTPPQGEPLAYMENLSYILEFADTLPFVQAATLEGVGGLNE